MYYPALDVTSGTGTGTTNRLGRQGREWWQRPTAWTMSAKMNWYQGKHSMKYGAEVRSYFGKAARFEPINLVFNSTLTANSSDSPDVVNTGNQWATFLLGALDGQTSARLVPLQTPQSQGWGAYFQDDFRVNDRLTLNMGLRWEYEPGATDADNRLSVRYDLTQPIPEMQATPPVMPAQALSLDGQQGLRVLVHRRVGVRDRERPERRAHLALELPAPLRRGLQGRAGQGGPVRLRPLPAVVQRRARNAG